MRRLCCLYITMTSAEARPSSGHQSQEPGEVVRHNKKFILKKGGCRFSGITEIFPELHATKTREGESWCIANQQRRLNLANDVVSGDSLGTCYCLHACCLPLLLPLAEFAVNLRGQPAAFWHTHAFTR